MLNWDYSIQGIAVGMEVASWGEMHKRRKRNVWYTWEYIQWPAVSSNPKRWLCSPNSLLMEANDSSNVRTIKTCHSLLQATRDRAALHSRQPPKDPTLQRPGPLQAEFSWPQKSSVGSAEPTRTHTLTAFIEQSIMGSIAVPTVCSVSSLQQISPGLPDCTELHPLLELTPKCKRDTFC